MMLDPRAKLWCTLLAVAGISLTVRVPVLAGELAVMCAGVLSFRLARPYRSWAAVILPTALFFGAVTLIASDGMQALGAALRIVAVGTAFFLFFRTTPPDDLADSLRQMGAPYPITFVLSASLSFVPTIRRLAMQIYDAQRSRGIPLGPGIRTIRHYAAFFIPLLIGAFRVSDQLSEALEIRGFDSHDRTPPAGYRFGPLDWLVCAAAALLFLLLLILPV